MVDVYLNAIGNRLKSNGSVPENFEREDYKVKEGLRNRKKVDITPEIRKELKIFECEYSEESLNMAPKGKPDDPMTKADKEELQADISNKLEEMKKIMTDMKSSVDGKIDNLANKVDEQRNKMSNFK